MPAPERAVCDQEVRDRVTGDLGTTFLLEAGAGTGKTRVLVDRYVKCVLDEELGTGDVRTVAAITFTEKAAGELRQRVREEFEARAAEAEAGSDAADLIERALAALDDAPISTIHGFAGRLLREFPVEAGVDPAFEQLDGLGSDIARARLWEEWLTELAAGDPSEEAVEGAAGRRVEVVALAEDALRAHGELAHGVEAHAHAQQAREPVAHAPLSGIHRVLGRIPGGQLGEPLLPEPGALKVGPEPVELLEGRVHTGLHG